VDKGWAILVKREPSIQPGRACRMDEPWNTIRAHALELSERVAAAVFILLLGWLAIRILVGPLGRLLGRSRLDPSVASFLVNTARSALLLVVLVAVLQQLGVETASLLALLGTAGLAIALSLQGSLANFAAGLLLLSFRIVRVGDLVEVGDVRGRVSEILPFHVVIDTLDNQRVVVPNTLLTTTPVRNNSRLPTRRVQWTLSVAAGRDLKAVKQALRDRLRADPRVRPEPAPEVVVRDWAEDKRTLGVAAWVSTEDYPAVQAEMLEDLGRCVEQGGTTR
jgi:small conductance mechanosensitive channel